jgi:hypothetical protein
MVMELKVYNVTKNGGTPAVMNALMTNGICTRKLQPVKQGCLAVPLTKEEVNKLIKAGCEVHEAKDKQPLAQQIP